LKSNLKLAQCGVSGNEQADTLAKQCA